MLNLPTEEFLRNIFHTFGDIQDVVVKEHIVHEDKGSQEGYGFVTYRSEDAAIAAVSAYQASVVGPFQIECTLSHRSKVNVENQRRDMSNSSGSSRDVPQMMGNHGGRYQRGRGGPPSVSMSSTSSHSVDYAQNGGNNSRPHSRAERHLMVPPHNNGHNDASPMSPHPHHAEAIAEQGAVVMPYGAVPPGYGQPFPPQAPVGYVAMPGVQPGMPPGAYMNFPGNQVLYYPAYGQMMPGPGSPMNPAHQQMGYPMQMHHPGAIPPSPMGGNGMPHQQQWGHHPHGPPVMAVPGPVGYDQVPQVQAHAVPTQQQSQVPQQQQQAQPPAAQGQTGPSVAAQQQQQQYGAHQGPSPVATGSAATAPSAAQGYQMNGQMVGAAAPAYSVPPHQYSAQAAQHGIAEQAPPHGAAAHMAAHYAMQNNAHHEWVPAPTPGPVPQQHGGAPHHQQQQHHQQAAAHAQHGGHSGHPGQVPHQGHYPGMQMQGQVPGGYQSQSHPHMAGPGPVHGVNSQHGIAQGGPYGGPQHGQQNVPHGGQYGAPYAGGDVRNMPRNNQGGHGGNHGSYNNNHGGGYGNHGNNNGGHRQNNRGGYEQRHNNNNY